MKNVYVYGIIEAEDFEIETRGVAGAERVYTVTHRDLSAVVSDIDTTEPERSDENVKVHDEVLREIMAYDAGRTVVPMGFGMAFANAGALQNVLQGARRAFIKALQDVEGTVELGIKVVSEKGTRVDADRIRKAAEETLDPVSVSTVENDRFSDRLLLNRSYLVERDRQEEFGDAVERFEAELGDDAIVQYTGPWAPYNFVEIRVGAEQ